MPIDWSIPLAGRMRPTSLDDFVGQPHLLGEGKPLTRMLRGGHLHNLILWGPPGSGKTTLARLLSEHAQAEFRVLPAVTSGVQDIRQAVQNAQQIKQEGRQVLLFVDEVHRFNKSQQDAFLPYMEDGSIVLVGATTENPAFELNNALLSRARVYVLRPLSEADLGALAQRALEDTTGGLGELNLAFDAAALPMLVDAAHGDARRLLTMLELAADMVLARQPAVPATATATAAPPHARIDVETLRQVTLYRVAEFDKHGDHFYDQISALHKSIRGSDPDAALYWAQRMLLGGCDPHYLLRRLVRIASEDVGNADPRALSLAIDAWNSYDRLGVAEGELSLSHAVVYLAVAPKSNAVARAHDSARAAAKTYARAAVPLHIRNAPTKLAKAMGMGKHYRYSHDEPLGFSAGQDYFPDDMPAQYFYQPREHGLEKKIAAKLNYLRQLNEQAKAPHK